MLRSLAYALVVLLALYAPAHAQVAPPPNFQPVLDEAIREFALGNYVESLALFREAQRAWPNARALRAIGRCQYELGDYVAAHASLEEALATSVRPLDAAQRLETEHLIERVREHVARYTIVTDPPAASLRVDGVAVTPDANGRVLLPLGLHSVEASATGYLPGHREVSAVAQRDERLEMRLVPLVTETSEAVETADPVTHEDRPRRKKWWIWTSVAGAAAAAAVATAVILTRDEPKADLPSGGTSGVAIGVPSASP
jgi:tetratricopeptide (TPR) repeat protein